MGKGFARGIVELLVDHMMDGDGCPDLVSHPVLAQSMHDWVEICNRRGPNQRAGDVIAVKARRNSHVTEHSLMYILALTRRDRD